jgi:hypothetical protein
VRERSQILRAEWALLNEPDRLRQVAQRHLALEPMAPAQFIREAELERRLPAARVFAGPPSLFGPVEVAAKAPEALMVPSPVAAAPAAPTPSPPAAPRQAQAEPPPRSSAAAVSPVAPRPAPPPAPPRATPALHLAPAAPPPPAMVASALGGTGGALPPPVPLARPVPVGAPQGATR